MLKYSLILVLAIIIAYAIANIPSEPVLPVVYEVLSVIVKNVIIVEERSVVKEIYVVAPPTTTIRAATSHKNVVAVVSDTSVDYLRLLSLDTYTGRRWIVRKPIVTPLRGCNWRAKSYIEVSLLELPRLNGYYIISIPQYTIFNEIILNKTIISSTNGTSYYYDKNNHALLAKSKETTVHLVKNLVLILREHRIRKFIICSPYTTSMEIPQILWSIKIGDCIVKDVKVNTTSRVKELAKKLLMKTGEQATLAELIHHIIKYLRTTTKYTLNTTILSQYTGEDDLVDAFLFKIKAGVCYHYASAAAILLRSVGIKANLVVGYTEGIVANGLKYFTSSYHSWVEVYVPKLNAWVPFDPTPPGRRASPINITAIIEQTQGEVYEKTKTEYTMTSTTKAEYKNTTITSRESKSTTSWRKKEETKIPLSLILLKHLLNYMKYIEENVQSIVLYSIPFILVILDLKDVIVKVKSHLRRKYRRVTREVIRTLRKLERKYDIKLDDELTLRENITKIMTCIPKSKRKYLKLILETYEKARFGLYPESKACKEIKLYRRLLT